MSEEPADDSADAADDDGGGGAVAEVVSEAAAEGAAAAVEGEEEEEEEEEAEGAGSEYETVWTCDVCGVATFRTYEDAVEHERGCTGGAETPREGGTEGSAARDGGAAPGDGAEQDGGRSASGPAVEAGASDPHRRRSDVTRRPPQSESGPISLSSVRRVWTCDVCRTATFSSYEEAAKHEKACAAKEGAEKEGEKGKGPGEEEAKGPKGAAAAAAAAGRGSGESGRNGAEGGSAPAPAPAPADRTDKRAVVTIWTCDICRTAEFRTYEEAERHERGCKGGGGGGGGATRDQTSAPAPAAASPPSPLLVLSPLVRGPGDAPGTGYAGLSHFGAGLLSAVDLVEVGEGGGDARLATFRCHYCRSNLPGPWTIENVGGRLPGLLSGHLTCKCRSIPCGVLTALMKLQAVRGVVGETRLADFLSAFFAQNGIAEKDKSGVKRLVVLDIGECRSDLAPGCRRRQWMASVEPIHRHRHTHTPGPKSQASRTSTKGGGPIPVLHSSVSAYCSQLSQFNQLALAQMNLAPQEGLGNPAGVRRLDPQCKHCGATFKAGSVDTLHKGCYSMTHSHLLKSCPHVPAHIRTTLQNYQKIKKAGSIGGGALGLRAYFGHLSRALGLVDIGADGTGRVAPGFGIPANVREVPSREREGRRDGGPEPHPAASAGGERNKRASDGAAPPASGLAAKRRRTDQPQAREAPIRCIPEAVVYVDDDGVRMNLPPAGGVPLLSSLTSTAASKLSLIDRLVLDQLELCEIEEGTTSRNHTLLGLRCQNCKADPVMDPVGSIKKLSTVLGWSSIVHEMGKGHVPRCSCLALFDRQLIIKEQNDGNDKNQNVSLSLKAYCNYLTTLYGMEDSRDDDGPGVTWGPCAPLEPGYTRPNPMRKKTTVNAKPYHNPILAESFESGGKMPTSMPSPQLMVVSDFVYLMIAQLELVPTKRKAPSLSKNANETTATTRQRNPRRSHENGSLSPPQSGGSSPSKLEVGSISGEALGLRCKHCHLTKHISSLRELIRNMAHQYYFHFKKCPNFPEFLTKELDKLKALQASQKSQVVKSLPEYCRKAVDIYEMKDLGWNGVSSSVCFGSNISDIIEKMGIKNDEDADFALPLLLGQYVRPVTTSLVSSVNAAYNNMEGAKKAV